MKMMLAALALLATSLTSAVAQEKVAPKVPELRTLTKPVLGSASFRVNKEHWKEFSERATTTTKPFRSGEPFVTLIPDPNGDEITTACVSDPGEICVPRVTPFGVECRCKPIKTGPPPLKPFPERCQLSFTEDGRPLGCAALKDCKKGCCQPTVRRDGIRLEIGCKCDL